VILATNSRDVLTGGAAQDQFVFAPTSSGPSVQHTITDFAAGVDKIDVWQFSNISAAALPTETQQGSDTLITLDGIDTLLLKNVAAVSLHASDFIVHAQTSRARKAARIVVFRYSKPNAPAKGNMRAVPGGNMRADAHTAQAARARLQGVPIRAPARAPRSRRDRPTKLYGTRK
jgi:hypothetical protein